MDRKSASLSGQSPAGSPGGDDSTGAQLRSEQAFVARLKAGDDAAFETLVTDYSPRLYAVARRFLHKEQDVQDVVQEAFLSALNGLAKFEGTSLFSTWLHRITVNACLMKLRSKRRKPERSIEDLLPKFVQDGHQRSPSNVWKPHQSSGIEQAEVRAVVRARIDELPDQYREVLLLRDIEELDTQATATVLGISGSAVKTRLHRARQALRTLLDPYFTEGQA
ncbi:MAG: sigma-70 family RNA polymerase sigma factor [Pyrinomonadaceae bacterium]|nr:sigma-70 family RNA polymerase sigma factor [Phycisphaerales bacterium]